jgi:hypothetical protein
MLEVLYEFLFLRRGGLLVSNFFKREYIFIYFEGIDIYIVVFFLEVPTHSFIEAAGYNTETTR